MSDGCAFCRAQGVSWLTCGCGWAGRARAEGFGSTWAAFTLPASQPVPEAPVASASQTGYRDVVPDLMMSVTDDPQRPTAAGRCPACGQALDLKRR